MSTIISPRKPGSSLQNFVHINAPDSNVRTSRDAIKGELSGKLDFNVVRVFDRLGIDEVPLSLVEACLQSLSVDVQVQNAKARLAELSAATGKVDEKQMYPPLSTIFSHIEQFIPPGVPRRFDRQLLPIGSSTLTVEGDSWSFPLISPDFTLLDITDVSPRINTNTSASKAEKPTRLWRCRSGFVEVKPNESQGPVPSEPGTVKEIVIQAADYARLHMSARPFQLFSIGLLIFGSKFCTAIFDRGGIQFSPVKDIWDDVRTFIRVIRRLTWDMSPAQLGQDPTVRILTSNEDEAVPWQKRAKEMGMPSFPTCAVTMGTGSRCWYTLGPPIWSSLSLLGRGTAVWRVCDSSKPGKLLVLKNAWRSGERLAESTIYEAIGRTHPGVAEFKFGADVVFPGGGRPITVNSLRDGNNTTNSPTLHRLLIATIGRPLWDYSSDLELLQGVRSALKGHKFLYDQGILHRDVSAGNILLSYEQNAKEGHEGFIMDIEYAHIARSSVDTVTTTHVSPIRGPGGVMTPPVTRTHTKFNSVKRGVAMTGTAQFMAYEVLEAIYKDKPIVQDCHHDIESFIWVLCYSIGRRWVINPGKMGKDRHAKLSEFFHNNFGRMKLHTILATRIGISGPLDIAESFPEIVSSPLVPLFSRLRGLVYAAHSPPDSPNNSTVILTYEQVFRLLAEAIEKLKSS